MTRWIALGLAMLTCAGCRGDAQPTVRSGTLTLALSAGGANDGALVVVVTGAPVTSVAAAPGYEVTSNTDAAGTHIIITGNVTTGALATLTVPDLSKVTAYGATVEQAADRTTFALLDPASYKASVR